MPWRPSKFITFSKKRIHLKFLKNHPKMTNPSALPSQHSILEHPLPGRLAQSTKKNTHQSTRSHSQILGLQSGDPGVTPKVPPYFYKYACKTSFVFCMQSKTLRLRNMLCTWKCNFSSKKCFIKQFIPKKNILGAKNNPNVGNHSTEITTHTQSRVNVTENRKQPLT